MDFDPAHLMPFLWAAVVAGFTWLGKEILKPWSDAALMRARAFTAYVESQGKGQDILVTESKRQTDLLVSLDLKTTRQNTTLEEMNTSSKAICKAESQGCQAGQVALILGGKFDDLSKALGLHTEAVTAKTPACPDPLTCKNYEPK